MARKKADGVGVDSESNSSAPYMLSSVVLGESLVIPLCSACGMTADAWAHDERNGEGHPFKRAAERRLVGQFRLVDQGDASKPFVLQREEKKRG